VSKNTITSLIAAALAFAAVTATTASAEDAAAYPSKPVTIIVPFPPGASTDLMARYIAPKLKDALGQSFIVENKSGAGGMIGGSYVAKAAPDGYTLLVASSTVHNGPILKKAPLYDSTKDFAPVIALLSHPFVLVGNSKLPADIGAVIAYAKANPGKLNFATLGGFNDLFCEMFNHGAGTRIELVHYRGAAENSIGVVRGDSHLTFNGYSFVQPQVDAGQLRLLAVTSLHRSPMLPQTPALNESGVPGFEVINVVGVLAPAGTPAPIVAKLNAAIAKIMNTPEAKQFVTRRGNDTIADQSPDFYRNHIKAESDKVARVVAEVGFEKN
jgi:tripartite-type tricarboxylate transporter receptor subunit TctC